MQSDFFIGLDLGQVQDYSALAVVERVTDTQTNYFCRHLQRWQLGTAYPQIVETVQKLVTTKDARGYLPLCYAHLVVDTTAAGKPVADMLRSVPELVGRIVSVVITGGLATTTGSDGRRRVSKTELVSVLQVLLQSRRLQIAGGLEHATTLEEELRTFRLKVPATNETFEEWRERDHDEILMALGVAVWYAEKNPLKVSEGPVVLVPGRQDVLACGRYPGTW